MSLSWIEYECTPARMPVVGKSCAQGNAQYQQRREIVLKDPEIQSAIGYLYAQAKAQGNIDTGKGMVSIQVGQDYGAGSLVGWSASAWLIIPVIEE